MTCIKLNGGIICAESEKHISVDGQTIKFERHSYFGPIPLNKDGSVRESPRKVSFYDAVKAWETQGSEVVDGLCVWELGQ